VRARATAITPADILAPHTPAVRALADQAGLFDRGGARLEQVRYVTVRSLAEARRPELTALRRAAVLHGAV
jgi:hypothetical protein